jgi:ankyrin repeat protein
MGGGLSLINSSQQNDAIVSSEDAIMQIDESTQQPKNFNLEDRELFDNEEDVLDDFNDFTVMDDFDDASAGTDQRVIRILNLSQHEKNQELLNACCHGDESEVAILLKYGAEPKRLDWDSCSTPFQLAKDGKDRWSPLHAAAREGHRKICQMLIKAHSPVDFQNGW